VTPDGDQMAAIEAALQPYVAGTLQQVATKGIDAQAAYRTLQREIAAIRMGTDDRSPHGQAWRRQPAANAKRRRVPSVVNHGLGAIAACLIFSMMGVTVVDVIGRYGFDRPLPGASEVTEAMLAVTIFAALPLVTLENGQITITLLTERFTPKGRRLQGALVALFSALVLALNTWRLFRHAAQLASYGDVTLFLGLPRAPLAYLMASLAGLAACAAGVLAVRRRRARAGGGVGGPL
jgi:TRAP-type transport system small permease protein